MQRARQNPGSGRWSTTQLLRSVEESQTDRRGLTTRSGLSELSNSDSVFDTSRRDTQGVVPAAQSMELPFSSDQMTTTRGFPSGTGIGNSSRTRGSNQVLQRSRSSELNAETGSCADGTEIDIFHDCMDLEENASFSNMFDDLDLEGTELLPSRNDHAAYFVQSDSMQREPMYNPVAPTGSSSRGSSCKRKSCNAPATNPQFQNNFSSRHVHEGLSDQEGVDFSAQRPLLLAPPSAGASSSGAVGLMEGPRPQKTRLSTDVVDSSLGGSVFGPLRASDLAGGSASNNRRNELNLHMEEAQQMYPRAVRRAFPPVGPEAFRSRRPSLLDYSSNPDLNIATNYGHVAYPAGASLRDGRNDNTSLAILRSVRSPSPRIHSGGSAIATGQGLSRRIGRISSSRSMSASPSVSSQREQNESRMRSIRMACLESGALSNNHGSSIRRGVANYFPLGANPSRRPSMGESRQPSYHGRATLLSRPPPPGMSASHSMAPPQVPMSLLEPPEMRPPSGIFEGSQPLRPPIGVGRRELLSATEGFMAIPPDFNWEHHRPRLMAGGLAEILRALERVERDEDLTREQLLMLEATTFLFGGIGLHDDHNDWRLDIDNMSYEELLALGDRIGTVSTGLSEDAIARHLRKNTYASGAFGRGSEDCDVKCCICQEEYEEHVELGTIDCGHSYHPDCIRQWLVRKNSCPICKAAALPQEPSASGCSSNSPRSAAAY